MNLRSYTQAFSVFQQCEEKIKHLHPQQASIILPLLSKLNQSLDQTMNDFPIPTKVSEDECPQDIPLNQAFDHLLLIQQNKTSAPKKSLQKLLEETASSFNVPLKSLESVYYRRKPNDDAVEFKKALTKEQEDRLLKVCIYLAGQGHPLFAQEITSIVETLFGISLSKGWGMKWLHEKREKGLLALRRVKALSPERNRKQVLYDDCVIFASEWDSFQKKFNKVPASCMVNCDEFRLTILDNQIDWNGFVWPGIFEPMLKVFVASQLDLCCHLLVVMEFI